MATFLLEVGTEELPASFVDEALSQWRSRVSQSLAEHSLSPNVVEVYGTPRRLALLIQGLPSQQSDQVEDIKGPPAHAAFKEGKPTQAAIGFARSRNVDLAKLETRTTDKGDFVFVRQIIRGRPTAEILTELVPAWIVGLEGKRFMRWGSGDMRFSRPIRWLVALLDEAVLPLELVNGSEIIRSDRRTQGHRVLHPDPVVIDHAVNYLNYLEKAFVQVDPTQRQTTIASQVQQAAQGVSGRELMYPDLLQEVKNLVEWPSAVVGKFDPEFLSLPAEVIKTVMVSHQRYFPIVNPENTEGLLPYFVTVSNGNPTKQAVIAAGNERVIRARLSDAQFFFKADQAIPLEAYLPRL
ncbi:MAG TPA: glycine--tRNA ligase subunit beta, partial [Candidatus Caenarcaniphilales bacterium]